MRYLLALVCPPAALLACHRPWQAGVVLLLCLAGLASWGWGVGILLLCWAILWAANGVGDDRAAAASKQFIRAVRPVRSARG